MIDTRPSSTRPRSSKTASRWARARRSGTTHTCGRGAVIGDDCIVGGKSYIANGVRIGDPLKINAMVYICTGVTIGDGVMISAARTFTNDLYPRACVNDLSQLRPSELDEHTTFTTVQDGVTVGPTPRSARIWSRPILGGRDGGGRHPDRPALHVGAGAPARPVALVCRCARPVADLRNGFLRGE